mmetsp:Transcript_2931/g.7655  ORF Transcript_2931/g.7655 Transcript_2931/m.7655 type:complete len:270 (+) Transcript_2931:2090-2899(+)
MRNCERPPAIREGLIRHASRQALRSARVMVVVEPLVEALSCSASLRAGPCCPPPGPGARPPVPLTTTAMPTAFPRCPKNVSTSAELFRTMGSDCTPIGCGCSAGLGFSASDGAEVLASHHFTVLSIQPGRGAAVRRGGADKGRAEAAEVLGADAGEAAVVGRCCCCCGCACCGPPPDPAAADSAAARMLCNCACPDEFADGSCCCCCCCWLWSERCCCPASSFAMRFCRRVADMTWWLASSCASAWFSTPKSRSGSCAMACTKALPASL